jgi:hypothetical protein
MMAINAYSQPDSPKATIKNVGNGTGKSSFKAIRMIKAILNTAAHLPNLISGELKLNIS